VLISDSAGVIEYVNPAFEGTTGFTRQEALGRTPRLLKSGYHAETFYHDMWSRLLAGEPYRGTLVNRKKSGELYWANQTITPIKNPQGTVSHFVAVLKDMTELRKYHEQEVQLRLARAVQERFNPLAPHVPGLDIAAASHPAAETGGDYFDFIEAPNGVMYVAVGDVSGHGFDAALIMALTRAYMRSFATLGMDVGEVLGHVNRAIIGDLEPERYVTMLLVRLDVATASMAYANAGHIPGALLDRSGGLDWIMDSTGIPLGLFADARFATRHGQVRTEQILVLGTDGATETADVDGNEFGHEGVLEYVRRHASETAQEIAAGVNDAARSFGASDDQHDDITSVIVKVTHVALSADETPLPLDTVAGH
jgi:sigma-B regulation protein RsbU (phosphoserine phosphatase)